MQNGRNAKQGLWIEPAQICISHNFYRYISSSSPRQVDIIRRVWWYKVERDDDPWTRWKPTIHRTRRAPPRAPSQPQPWPAYVPPRHKNPKINNKKKKAHVITILQSYRLVLNDFINGYKTYVTTYATRETCPALKGVERSSDTLRRHLGPLALRAFTMSGKLGRVVKKPSGKRICLE